MRKRRAPICDKVIAENTSTAIASLSYREALIYRDWQDAIGDSVLQRDEDSVRKFKIIGYEDFEKLLERDNLWIEVFRESIVDIDFDAFDPSDFRADQLSRLAASVSELLKILAGTAEKDLINFDALEKAEQLSSDGKK